MNSKRFVIDVLAYPVSGSKRNETINAITSLSEILTSQYSLTVQLGVRDTTFEFPDFASFIDRVLEFCKKEKSFADPRWLHILIHFIMSPSTDESIGKSLFIGTGETETDFLFLKPFTKGSLRIS